jgi:hypothetical protein
VEAVVEAQWKVCKHQWFHSRECEAVWQRVCSLDVFLTTAEWNTMGWRSYPLLASGLPFRSLHRWLDLRHLAVTSSIAAGTIPKM